MDYKKIILLFLVFSAASLSGFAQNIFTDLRGSEKKADFYYSRLSYSKAIYFYSQALQKNNNYALSMKVAELYKKMAQYEEAKKCFENSIAAGYTLTAFDSICFFNILQACSTSDSNTTLSKEYSAKVLYDLFRDSLYYVITELPFNSDYSEYCPVAIGNGLLYVSDKESSSLIKKYNTVNDGGFATIYYREKKDSIWSIARKIELFLENVLHIGPVAFYNNNQKAIINVCVKDKKKPYRLLLYTANYDSLTKKWKDIYPMSFNNKLYSVGHPAISEDGKTIFFVSDRKGGQGGTDIYCSLLLNGKWTEPVNLGLKINSKGDEKYPYLSKDNILFFSSDGRYGIGGLDIYYIDLDFKDTTVFNIGSPVNSNLDDFGFSYDQKNKTGYFSSNRKTKGKQDDLYMLKENKIFLSVSIKDDFDKKDLENAKIQIWDIELNSPIKHFPGNQSNTFNTWLRPMHRYKIIIQNEDYRNDTLMVSTYTISDYSLPLSKVIYSRRRYIYYGDLKLKMSVKEGGDTSIIIVNNITNNAIDTIVCEGLSHLLKLDAECAYIITSRNGDALRYIYIEKKEIKNLSAKLIYNMYLSSTQPTVFRVLLKKCIENSSKDSLMPEIRIVDWVNRNEFKISPGPDGDFQFVVTDGRLFDLYLNENKLLYSRQEIKFENFCIFYID